MIRRALSSVLLLSACGVTSGSDLPPAVTSAAPALGKADGTDSADRECNVVLRDVNRVPNSTGGYETECTGSNCYYVWAGHVDVASAAIAEGATVAVLYHLEWDQNWYEVAAVADGPGAPGMTRYSFRAFDHLVGSGMSYTSLNRTRIQLAPFLRLADGGRLFDHNRNPGDFDTYLLTIDNGWRIGDTGAVCLATAPNSATIRFSDDWSEVQSGEITAGGSLNLMFDLDRLPGCRATHNGNPAWDTEAYVKFHPGNELFVGSVREFESPYGTPTTNVHEKLFTVTVPVGATDVEMWFRNYSGAGSMCETWDSNSNANYWFDVAAAPGAPDWMGNVGVQISRAADAPCTDDVPVTGAIQYDSWARTRATYANVCFEAYEPGVTDRANPDLWQQLDVQVHFRFDDGGFQSAYVNTVGMTGNNALYALPLGTLDPFRPYHCPDVPFTTETVAGSSETVDVARMEFYFTVNGAELRPAPDALYTATFQNYAGANSAYCQ